MSRGTIRVVLAVATLCLAPASTYAQSPPALPAIGLPLPQIAPPLPPIGLPLAPLGLGPALDTHPRAPRPPHSDTPPRGHDRPGRRPGRGGAVVYYVAPYPWVEAPAPAAAEPVPTPAPMPPPTPAPGLLYLQIEPAAGLQVYVDGEYVGTMEDVGGVLELDAGSRRIEVRAADFEPLVLDARIVAGRAITYRGVLERRASPLQVAKEPIVAPPAPTAPATKQTFYLIPGCYMGNVPPSEVRLPEGCDPSRVITRTP